MNPLYFVQSTAGAFALQAWMRALATRAGRGMAWWVQLLALIVLAGGVLDAAAAPRAGTIIKNTAKIS